MKKILYYLFATLMCALCFSACGKTASNSASNSEQKESNIAFVSNEISLCVGESVQAEVVTSKNNVFIFWSIRDEDLATVSDNGVITALAEGQTICYAEFAGEMVMCLVKITAEQAKPMLSVSVPYANNSVTIYVGDSLDMRASVKLGDSIVDGAEVGYDIKQTEIVSVEDGKVIGQKVGTATIAIQATDEGQNATLTLTVNVVAK